MNFTGLNATAPSARSDTARASGEGPPLRTAARGHKYDAAVIESVLFTLQDKAIRAEAGITLQFVLRESTACRAKLTTKLMASVAAGGGLKCRACDKCLKKFPPGSVVDVVARANKYKTGGRQFLDGPWSVPPVKFTV